MNPLLSLYEKDDALAPYEDAVDLPGFVDMLSLYGGGSSPGQGPRRPAPTGNIDQQLIAGFMRAGRPDLAKMVGGQAFETWMNQESGGDPTAVSPANNQGQANGGLFQFWYGHDFSDPYEGANNFTMPVAKQAKMAATQFNLTPERIREFARQIRQGDYAGWG